MLSFVALIENRAKFNLIKGSTNETLENMSIDDGECVVQVCDKLSKNIKITKKKSNSKMTSIPKNRARNPPTARLSCRRKGNVISSIQRELFRWHFAVCSSLFNFRENILYKHDNDDAQYRDYRCSLWQMAQGETTIEKLKNDPTHYRKSI